MVEGDDQHESAESVPPGAKAMIKPFQKQDLARAACHDGLILAWDTGLGKAVPVHSLVQTPEGYRAIGGLLRGDKVTATNGKPATVTGVFHQGVRDAYKVTFSDGVTSVCDLEHLWMVRTKIGKYRGWPFRPKPLSYLLEHGLRVGLGCRFFIPMCQPVEFDPQPELPMHPYLMGLMLGNGCMSI